MKTKRAQHLKAGDTVKGLTVVGSVAVPADGTVYVRCAGSSVSFRLQVDDEVEVEGDWTREELDEVIDRLLPDRLLTFYTEGPWDVASVEDAEGHMWRVWADDDAEGPYKL